ncbi:MAG: hypothetical protein WBS16_08420, partial [Thermoplasmata archaeon]
PPPPPPPPPAARRNRTRRFRLPTDLRRVFPAILVLAFVLGLISLGTAWWSYSDSTTNEHLSVNFVPGGTYYLACSGSGCAGFNSGSFPYSVQGGGSVGSVYETVLGVGAIAVALAGIVALLAVLAALGRTRSSPTLSTLLGGGTILLLIATMIWIVTAQPGAVPAHLYDAGTSASGASPQNSFWGSNGDGTASWGAGPGWYLALSCVVLLTLVLIVIPLLDRRRHGVGIRGAAAPSPVSGPVASRTYLPPPASTAPRRYSAPPPAVPVSRPTATRPPIPPSARPDPADPVAAATSTAPVPPPTPAVEAAEPVACPACGTPNPAKSRVCSYCQRPLRAP